MKCENCESGWYEDGIMEIGNDEYECPVCGKEVTKKELYEDNY